MNLKVSGMVNVLFLMIGVLDQNHGLVEGDFSLCHACRMPISEEDIASDEYIEGISCPNCFGTHSEEKKKRFAERQKQIKLAKQRGEKHIGKTY